MHRAHTMLVLLLSTLLALVSAGCAPPEPRDGEPHRPRSPGLVDPPRATEAFPEGRAQSAVQLWHDNPDLMPQALDGSALLLDAAGTGTSSIALPAGRPGESLVLVLTCARPVAYVLSLGLHEAPEPLTTTAGQSCGGPSITLFTTPPLDLSSTAAVDVDLPGDTAYYLAVYRAPRDAILPAGTTQLTGSSHEPAGTAPR